jgi:hypothetical protein
MGGVTSSPDFITLSRAPDPVITRSLEDRREAFRGVFGGAVFGLLALLALMVAWAVLFRGADWDVVREPIIYLVGPLLGLASSVVGFYFGVATERDKER